MILFWKLMRKIYVYSHGNEAPPHLSIFHLKFSFQLNTTLLLLMEVLNNKWRKQKVRMILLYHMDNNEDFLATHHHLLTATKWLLMGAYWSFLHDYIPQINYIVLHLHSPKNAKIIIWVPLSIRFMTYTWWLMLKVGIDVRKVAVHMIQW